MLVEIPLLIEDIGERALLAAYDCTHVGGWGVESLGPENMLIASLTDPDLLKGVCRISQDAHLRNLRAMLEQGIQAVFDSWFQCGPSVGWSPTTYRDMFLPLVKESIDLAHEFDAVYIYQDDGRMCDIIPALVAAGVDAISGLQPPPVGDVVLREAKSQCAGRAALVGGLDPCYCFDLGSADAVRTAAKQAIGDAAAGGGYILATAEAVDPMTTAECLHAAVQAAKDFGQYDRTKS
jgi:uroporphyrinogen-III decarboxylase